MVGRGVLPVHHAAVGEDVGSARCRWQEMISPRDTLPPHWVESSPVDGDLGADSGLSVSGQETRIADVRHTTPLWTFADGSCDHECGTSQSMPMAAKRRVPPPDGPTQDGEYLIAHPGFNEYTVQSD